MRERLQRGPYGPNNPPPPPAAPPPEAYEHKRTAGRGRPNRKSKSAGAAVRLSTSQGVCEVVRLPTLETVLLADIQALSLEKVTEPLIVVSLHNSARRSASGVESQDTSPVPVRSNGGFNGGCNNDQGGDMGQSSLPKVTADGRLSANTWSDQEQLGVSPLRAGYYVEDEVDWGEDDDDAPAKSEMPGQYHIHPQREAMVQEPFLGLPHFKNAEVDEIPATVQDLRGYDHRIKVMYERKPKNQRFINGGNGKVAPALYGSEQRHDLGLCFATFLTRKRCEMGVNCPWRHHPLSNAEKAWIIEYGKKKGKEFIDNNDRWWSYPEVPVPGASMQGFGDKDT
ncbi:unnamed protein product [Alternaria alternata]